MAIKMLKLKSYGFFVPSKLLFNGWDMKIEEDVGGFMRNFATTKVSVKVESRYPCLASAGHCSS